VTHQIHDLRSFLELLEAHSHLVRITEPVDLNHEAANVMATLEKIGGPVPLFTNLTNTPGRIPLTGNVLSHQDRIALALGCERDKVLDVIGHAMANPIPPKRVQRAAFQEHIITGKDIDLAMLPIPTHAELDGGAFISGGVTVSKDPVSGRGNLSYQRSQIKGPAHMGFMVNEWRHVKQFLDVQEAKNEPLEVAIAIGLDPAIMIGERFGLWPADQDMLKVSTLSDYFCQLTHLPRLNGPGVLPDCLARGVQRGLFGYALGDGEQRAFDATLGAVGGIFPRCFSTEWRFGHRPIDTLPLPIELANFIIGRKRCSPHL